MGTLVTYALTDGVAVITMDDGKANAMSSALQQEIHAALDQAKSAGVPVVLTGRAGILSAGFDLKTLAAGGQGAVDMLNGGLELAIRLLAFRHQSSLLVVVMQLQWEFSYFSVPITASASREIIDTQRTKWQ
jgi:enoyl-CoA hydratase/carnithine racemase